GELVLEGARVGLGIEIAALPAPIGPGAGEAVEHFLGGVLAARLAALRRLAPQEFRHALFGHRLQRHRHAGLAEIFLREHVAGDLAPALRNVHAGLGEHDRAVGISDLALGAAESDTFVGRLTLNRELTANAHDLIPDLPNWPRLGRAAPPFRGQFSVAGLAA